MSWSRKKTLTTLIFALLLLFAFAATALGLIVYVFLKKNERSQFLKSFMYFIGTAIGTGLGCIWFRVCRSRKMWCHALIHSISLGCMLYGHRELLQLLISNKLDECYNQYPISMLTICIYILQFILSFHFVLFRYGKTPSQKAFNTGLHAFTGAITLFVCITDGVLACHKLSRDEHFENDITFHIAAVCLFLYGVTVWYIILNPYFDWRRLNCILRTEDSKASFSARRKRSK